MAERIRKRVKKNKKTESFYRKYDFELIVLGLLLSGFFLLWESWHIKSIVWNFITKTARTGVILIRDIAVDLGTIISGVEISDLVGIALILIALILVINRARIRFIKSHLNISSCPQCEGGLHQTHRKMKHKLLEIFLFCKVKRYSCRKCSFDEFAMIITKK